MAKIETSNFKRLIGIWKTTGQIMSDTGEQKLDGIDSYEFILDGNYILHKADVKMGDERIETFEIISLENSNDKANMQYFNSKGETGIMSSRLNKNDFHIEGNKITFSGTINDENTLITGKWYLQAENNDWTSYIELRLEKQN